MTNQHRETCWASVCPFWSKEINLRMLLGQPHVTACHWGKLPYCTQKALLWFYFHNPFHSHRCLNTFHTVDLFFFFFLFAFLTVSLHTGANSILPAIVVIPAALHCSQCQSPVINLWRWRFACLTFKGSFREQFGRGSFTFLGLSIFGFFFFLMFKEQATGWLHFWTFQLKMKLGRRGHPHTWRCAPVNAHS